MRVAMGTNIGLGIAAVGLAEFAATRVGASVLDRLGRVVVDTGPLPLVERTVQVLGTSDKPVIRASVAATASLVIAAVLDRLGSPRPSRRGAVAATAVGVGALVAARRSLRATEASAEVNAPAVDVPDPLAPARDGAEDWPHATPLMTPVSEFYTTDVNMRPPVVDVGRWRLEIKAGDQQTSFSHDDLVALGVRERDAVLVCVHNRLGWDRLGQQRWGGVALSDVLAAAGLAGADAAVNDVVMTAVDGYRQVLPLEMALSSSWVVLAMGGQALTPGHGFPARVLTPGIVGQYNGVKWLQRLELVPRGSVTATWVDRGWDAEVVAVRPLARIDHPVDGGMPPRLPRGPVRVAAGSLVVVGTAWAPRSGVGRVEVRLDDGPWTDATLAAELNGDSWRRWRRDLDVTTGRRRIQARCTSRDGVVQDEVPSDPSPNGVGGLHTVRLRVG